MDLMKAGDSNVREVLLNAAFSFAQAAARLSGVRRIALIGSIVTDHPSPKDVDLLVYVSRDADLAPLAGLGRQLKGGLQSHSRGADVFLADDRGQYLGRTCSWKLCKPGVRASCDALHCGRRPYLHDDTATVRLVDSLIETPPLELWPAVIRRVALPADVEQFLARLGEPHNKPVNPTAEPSRSWHQEPDAQ